MSIQTDALPEIEVCGRVFGSQPATRPFEWSMHLRRLALHRRRDSTL